MGKEMVASTVARGALVLPTSTISVPGNWLFVMGKGTTLLVIPLVLLSIPTSTVAVETMVLPRRAGLLIGPWTTPPSLKATARMLTATLTMTTRVLLLVLPRSK